MQIIQPRESLRKLGKCEDVVADPSRTSVFLQPLYYNEVAGEASNNPRLSSIRLRRLVSLGICERELGNRATHVSTNSIRS